VKGLRQLISQSRQGHIDDSSDDEQTVSHSQATNTLSNQTGQCFCIVINSILCEWNKA